MSKFKYNPGDLIGPHKVLLLERDLKDTKMGTFKCTVCDKTFYSNIYNVNKGNRRFCDKHSIEYSKNIGKRFANSEKRKEAAREVIGKIKPGQKYGHLTVLERTDKTKNTKRIWKCQCDCENKTIVEIRSDLLLNGHTQSCGCVGSLGEQKLSKILTQLGYSFITQYKFNNCRNPDTNHQLRFDFYLPDYNCCIEYDGEQHFKDTSGWFNHYSFEKLKQRDDIKNKYCQNNNIKLIRISYTDYNKLTVNYIKERING